MGLRLHPSVRAIPYGGLIDEIPSPEYLTEDQLIARIEARRKACCQSRGECTVLCRCVCHGRN